MKRKSISRGIVVFYNTDLPISGAGSGFSLHRGVLVQWDEDEDDRILTFIDELPEQIRQQLLVAHEHEAGLSLLWQDSVPEGFEEGKDIDVDGDCWVILSSFAPPRGPIP